MSHLCSFCRLVIEASKLISQAVKDDVTSCILAITNMIVTHSSIVFRVMSRLNMTLLVPETFKS